MIFTDYWKEKAAKRRKSWVSKAKRFAEQHTQLEDIRKEVYLPLDFGVNFCFEDYKPVHFIKLNPIASWQDMNFCFSEDGLRAALESEGADMNSFKMGENRQSLKGKQLSQPKNRWEAYSYIPNKVFDYDKIYLDWLKRMYEICTDVETVHLNYRQITMTIKRYSTEGMPFGYYELNPCEQLTKSAMLLQETDFYTLNVATLLMEAAAEWELRQEELNYYAKKLKIRTMEAATTDSIEFELWDDKKIQKKLKEYAVKEYSLDQVLKNEQLMSVLLNVTKHFFCSGKNPVIWEYHLNHHFNYYYISIRDKKWQRGVDFGWYPLGMKKLKEGRQLTLYFNFGGKRLDSTIEDKLPKGFSYHEKSKTYRTAIDVPDAQSFLGLNEESQKLFLEIAYNEYVIPVIKNVLPRIV